MTRARVPFGALGPLLAAALGLAMSPVARAQPAATLGALLTRFAAMPGLAARFREEKRIGILAAPLVTEGTLHFAPPGRLARLTTRPEASALRVVGERLTVDRAGRTESLDLSRQPAVRSLVDGLRCLLAGDRARLERAFRVQLSAPSPAGWTLTLTPRDRATARLVRSMRIEGAGATLRTLRVEETTGDVSHTTFTEVDPTRRYSPGDLRRIFRSR